MKNRVQLLSVLLFISMAFLSIQQVIAQPRGPRQMSEEQIEKTVDDLAAKLTLTADQKTEVLGIYKAHHEKMKEIMQNTSGDRTAMREARQKVRAQMDSSIKKMLSNEQKDLFNEFMQEQRQKRGGGKSKRGRSN